MAKFKRPDGRAANALRPVTIEVGVSKFAEGSARIAFGDTIVLCLATITDGVPRSLPALFAAERLQERAARVKLRPPRIELPLDVDDPEFLGELLFDLVAEAREHGFDAETALREANVRFASHVARVEGRAKAEGRELESYTDAELRALWEATNGEVQAA